MGQRRAPGGHRDGRGQVPARGLEPAILAPAHRFQQALPAQGPEILLIAVRDQIPVACLRPLDKGCMATRPPGLLTGPGAHLGIVRRMFPRPVNRARTGRNHHVAGRRTGGAADGGEHVEPVAPAQHFRAFRAEAFHIPIFRIAPGVVDMFHRPVDGEAVIAEANAIAVGQEEVALAVLADDMAGIDMFGQPQIDRFAPWPGRMIGMDDIDGPVAVRSRRDVDVVAALMPDQVRRPDRADGREQGRRQGLPVHQVLRLPDHQPGIGVEGGEGEIVGVAILDDRGIRMVSGQDRIEKRPVTPVRLALPVRTASPRPAGGSGNHPVAGRAAIAATGHQALPRQGQAQGHRIPSCRAHHLHLMKRARSEIRPGPVFFSRRVSDQKVARTPKRYSVPVW